jgi:flagellar motor protein MotB
VIEKLGPIQHDRRNQYIWLTIYSDLITNLFLLFVSLYALSFIGPDAIQEAVASMKNRLEYVQKAAPWYEDLAHSLKMVSNQDALVVAREDRLQMALPEEVLFSPGEGELRTQDQLILHALAKALQNVPYTILIEGHTDNVPLGPRSRYASNWELSLARAMAVMNYLVEVEKLSPHRMGVAAFGEFHPRYPNDTPAHRSGNRRIEISILRYE